MASFLILEKNLLIGCRLRMFIYCHICFSESMCFRVTFCNLHIHSSLQSIIYHSYLFSVSYQIYSAMDYSMYLMSIKLSLLALKRTARNNPRGNLNHLERVIAWNS